MIATLASWRPREVQHTAVELANSNPARSIDKGETPSGPSSYLAPDRRDYKGLVTAESKKALT